MEQYLNSGIKEVISRFPAVEAILAEYDIGCGPCSVGTCLLKDIVEIHRLPADREQEMMARIGQIIDPEGTMPAPALAEPMPRAAREINYSPPMKILVDEHVLIKRWLALIPQVADRLDLKSEDSHQTVVDGIDLIRSYADRLHHGKEEDILFKYFDDSAEIFRVIYEDHRQARQHVQAMRDGLDRKDEKTVSRHLMAYRALLSEHIRKEDEILFPWLDEQLTTNQVGELFTRFQIADKQIAVDDGKYQELIDRLETQFAARGEGS